MYLFQSKVDSDSSVEGKVERLCGTTEDRGENKSNQTVDRKEVGWYVYNNKLEFLNGVFDSGHPSIRTKLVGRYPR